MFDQSIDTKLLPSLINQLKEKIQDENRQIEEYSRLIIQATTPFGVKPYRKRHMETGGLTDDEFPNYNGSKIKVLRRISETEKTDNGISDSVIVLELEDGTKLCCTALTLLDGGKQSAISDNNNNNNN